MGTAAIELDILDIVEVELTPLRNTETIWIPELQVIPNRSFGRGLIGLMMTGHMIYLNGDSFASNSNKAGFTQVNQGKIGAASSYFYYGDIAEIIAFESALPKEKVEQVHEYLALKWGLPISSPYLGALFLGFERNPSSSGSL